MINKLILLVDDEKILNDLFALALRQEGYTVLQAFNGKEALEQLQENPCQVMFIDINLPDIDGIELCHQIRTHLWSAQIHALTGDIVSLEQTLAGNSPFNSHLEKPLDISLLLETTAKAFHHLPHTTQPKQ